MMGKCNKQYHVRRECLLLYGSAMTLNSFSSFSLGHNKAKGKEQEVEDGKRILSFTFNGSRAFGVIANRGSLFWRGIIALRSSWVSHQ
jgi:hypothetical protein